MRRSMSAESRREFMARLAAAGALTAWGPASVGLCAPAAVRKRKDIRSLAPDSREIAALRAGVAVMKAKPISDPTSWSFQANIHGTLGDAENALWAQCQHGQWWFLPWHRMYLWHFERILIAAIRESDATLPADFGLPFWNYSDEPGARILPQVFRDRTYTPVGGREHPNPLYEASRRSRLNDAQNPIGFEADTVDTSPALEQTDFVSGVVGIDGFGGQRAGSPEHQADMNHGALEHRPHDLVHDAIGGLMGDPDTAANDPIFWLHHCNIDRLWNRWLSLGDKRHDPDEDATWCQQVFTFVDSDGQQATLPISKFLSYVQGNVLDYEYDDPRAAGPPVNTAACAIGREQQLAAQRRVVAHHLATEESSSAATTLTSFPPSLSLTTKPATFKLAVPQQHQAMMTRIATEPEKAETDIALRLSGIDPKSIDGGYYDVYVNLPVDEKPSRDSPSFVGSISSFALKGQARHAKAGAASEVSKTLLLTSHARTLKQKDRWAPHELTVTLVPREMSSEEPDKPRLVFQRISLVSVNADSSAQQ